MTNPTLPTPTASTAESTSNRFHPVGLTPKQIVGAYSDGQWEDFIEEWSSSLAAGFAKVERISGPGDKGRDVICLDREPAAAAAWVNYQAKHYAHPLMPSEAWIELAKLCYYTFKGDYPVPREYRFICPHDVGPALHRLLNNPIELKNGLIKAWPEKCETQLVEGTIVRLEGALLAYVEAFDFRIFGYTPVNDVIEGHRKTRFWQERFKTSLPSRPNETPPPDGITAGEAKYVSKLLDAYSDAEKRQFKAVDELQPFTAYDRHLKRARRAFFRADQLNRFSREISLPGAFEKFKSQIHDGIADTLADTHPHGLARVKAATTVAGTLQLGSCELDSVAEPLDRQGACHHLANDDSIKSWLTDE